MWKLKWFCCECNWEGQLTNGVLYCVWRHNMPPNTDHAHNKHIWNIICNFSQVQFITPWWWILCDPKHVGVIFNVCLLDFYITSMTVIIEWINWLINVSDNNDTRWKHLINYMTTVFEQLTIVQETDRAVTVKRCIFWKVRIDFQRNIPMGIGL